MEGGAGEAGRVSRAQITLSTAKASVSFAKLHCVYFFLSSPAVTLSGSSRRPHQRPPLFAF